MSKQSETKMSSQLFLSTFAKMYFAEWEINDAMKKSDPQKMLTQRAKRTLRGSGGPGMVGYMTGGNHVEIWMPENSFRKPPDYKIKIKDLALAAIKEHSQPDLFT